MNELARLVDFSFELTQNYRIVDRDGKPWFVVRDICRILGIRYYKQTISRFPAEWKDYIICAVTLSDGTSAKPRARKTQKVLIINEAGLKRLINRSDKPVARRFQDLIYRDILPAYQKHGINWAALPKVWYYWGEMLNHAEWMARKEEWYFKRFPDADYDDFLRSLPRYPPEPPEKGEKSG